jgi:hypothetical protein
MSRPCPRVGHAQVRLATSGEAVANLGNRAWLRAHQVTTRSVGPSLKNFLKAALCPAVKLAGATAVRLTSRRPAADPLPTLAS